MEDGFIDVEKVDDSPNALLTESSKTGAAGARKPAPAPPAPSGSGTRRSTRVRPPIGTYANLRRRSMSPDGSSFRRPTRSSQHKRKLETGPKLKLKVGDRGAVGHSFLGPWDRELDSDDDDLAFEEQFILRMPEGDDCERLRQMVAARDVPEDVWFKFQDSRRAVFNIGTTSYNAKLVDLPAIIESQKTLDNRQMFKVADICQMLLVENPIQEHDQGSAPAPAEHGKAFDVKDFIWPHGLTPPMAHVRKRRFRKRVNRTTIETVEKEVERLLAEDEQAEQTIYTFNSQSEASDSEYSVNAFDVGTPGFEMGSPRPDEENDSPSEKEEKDGEDDAFDAAFAAEIDDLEAAAYADDDSRSSGSQSSGDGDLFGDEDDGTDEDDDEDDETAQSRRLLIEEIRDISQAVDKKRAEITTVQNILIKRRFEDALKKLEADLASRELQLQQLAERKLAEDQAREQIELDSLSLTGVREDDEAGDGEGSDGSGHSDDERSDVDIEADDPEPIPIPVSVLVSALPSPLTALPNRVL